MNNIQIITNEWIDYIRLYDDFIAIRNFNNDKGIYSIEDNILKINWEKWGLETFINYNNIYYNYNSDFFEIELDSNEWNDIGIFDIKKGTIKRKYYSLESGKFKFINNDLLIEWKNWGIERFYQLNNNNTRLIYSNTKFANILKKSDKKEIKIIAIVFPQFHEIPENNKFWGNGFTEWTLLKTIPRIVNGEIIKKPHQDIGYFNLNDYNHRKYMRILANKYNIFGFCFYHYWFKDKKIMYEPTELMLIDDEPNKPFFFCWANEQWTKRWDGGNNEVLLEQEYGDDNANIKHFEYLLQFFKNKNYIKKYNKPIFIFYRIEKNDVDKINNIIKLWNKLAIEYGFDGIHFMKFLGPFNNNIKLDDIKGYVEFEPGYCCQTKFNDIISYDENKIFEEYNEDIYLTKNRDIEELVNKGILNNGYKHYLSINDQEKEFRTSKFFVYDGLKLYKNIINLEKIFDEQHRGITVGWNNTPRRNYISNNYDKYPHYYKNINYNIFGEYFYKLLKKISNNPNKGSSEFLFISAWNEWNEQAVLEPTMEDGYNYLDIINKKYLEYYNNPSKKNVLNFCHLGGGTEKYMKDIKNIFSEYNFIDFNNYNEMYNIDFIHINSMLHSNLKNNYNTFFKNNFKNIQKIITIHDYQWLFPDDPNILKENFYKVTEDQILNNIIIFKELLELCSIIIFPSRNIYNNYNIFIDLIDYRDKIHIVLHCDKIINYDFLYIPPLDKTINIAYIGYFVKYKGSDIFNKLVSKNKIFMNYEIKYHIFGYVSNEENIESDIILHHEYNDNEIIDLLHSNNIHGIVHLSLFEESYCYALTNSINSGIPIMYINHGSFSERLKYMDKYFQYEKNIDYYKFLDYIIENNNKTDNFYKLDNNVQPNKWYLENYL